MPATIRTTHTGSLPRPESVVNLLVDKERGRPIDAKRFDRLVAEAVDQVVRRQCDVGLTLVNDGEMSKMTYATYLYHRVLGLRRVANPERRRPPEAERYPVWWEQIEALLERTPYVALECVEPLRNTDCEPLRTDLRNLRAAADAHGPSEVFMTAASPGIVADYVQNHYYPTHEAYLAAIAEVMRPEYQAIVAAGFALQLDCPDLSAPAGADETERERDAKKALAVEAINVATAGIDPQRMRLHLCWGNLQAPHEADLPLAEVLPLAFRAHPAMVLFEAANPRHEHEWASFRDLAVPDEKVMVPGVIDNTTAFVEHPELVAQRIERFTELLGPERVVAGVDCGFGTWAAMRFDPELAFAKLRSLVDGAAIASRRA